MRWATHRTALRMLQLHARALSHTGQQIVQEGGCVQ